MASGRLAPRRSSIRPAHAIRIPAGRRRTRTAARCRPAPASASRSRRGAQARFVPARAQQLLPRKPLPLWWRGPTSCRRSSSSPPCWMRMACAGGCWSASAPRRPTPSTSCSTWRWPTTTAPRPPCRGSQLAARGTRVIKRDMKQGLDEVRVMTVHGAKGLERRSCFLPDTCSTRSGPLAGQPPQARDGQRPTGASAPFVWPVKGRATRRRAAGEGGAREGRGGGAQPLLYVALTRARDRLYVTGFEGINPPPPDCWYNLIRAVSPIGWKRWRLPRGVSCGASPARRPPSRACEGTRPGFRRLHFRCRRGPRRLPRPSH